jgi:hypothetical protein
MPKYLVTVRDSKKRKNGIVTSAPTMSAARAKIRNAFRNVRVDGMGGRFRPVASIIKAERVPEDTPLGWVDQS